MICSFCEKDLVETTIEYFATSEHGEVEAMQYEEMLCPDEDCEGRILQEPYQPDHDEFVD